jgi:hypothetical protein
LASAMSRMRGRWHRGRRERLPRQRLAVAAERIFTARKPYATSSAASATSLPRSSVSQSPSLA